MQRRILLNKYLLFNLFCKYKRSCVRFALSGRYLSHSISDKYEKINLYSQQTQTFMDPSILPLINIHCLSIQVSKYVYHHVFDADNKFLGVGKF